MYRLALVFLLAWVSSHLFAQSDSAKFNLGIEYAQNYQYDSAKSLLEYSVSDSSSISLLDKGKAHSYLRRVYWNGNDFSTALSHGNKSVEIFTQLDNQKWLGYALYDLCMNNLIAGSYDIALTQAQESYEAFEKVQDTSMMIWSMARRGIVFHDIGEYEEGIRVCNQAQQIFNEYSGKNADIQAMIWGITAINYDDGGSSDKAVKLYKKILPLEEKLSSDREIIRTYNNMGNSLMKLGQLDEAEEYFLLNLKANIRDDFQYGIATVKTNLGTIAYKKDDFNKAERLLNEAEQISFEISDAEKVLDVLQQKHLLFEQKNDPNKSLAYLQKYHHLKDSLYDLDKQRQIRFLETQFETEKKEQQIALQRAEISEQEAVISKNRLALAASVVAIILLVIIGLLWRNRTRKKQLLRLQDAKLKAKEAEINAAISSQEKERSRYARDLHDGFGQMISILNMNLQSLKTNAKTDERHHVFDSSSKVIDDMYQELKNICFDLMPQTLIKSGLESALKEFVGRINQSGKIFVELNVFGLTERLSEVQEISLYRISQEWVNNILKYSDADKITLQITKDEEEITLLIEDNGSGFDRNLLTSGKGNGWKNLNSRTSLIKGELELETTLGNKGNILIINAPSILKVEENTMSMV